MTHRHLTVRKTVFAFAFLLALLLLLPALVKGEINARKTASITISGTVTGPGGPAAGVWVAVSTPSDWRDTTTANDGNL